MGKNEEASYRVVDQKDVSAWRNPTHCTEHGLVTEADVDSFGFDICQDEMRGPRSQGPHPWSLPLERRIAEHPNKSIKQFRLPKRAISLVYLQWQLNDFDR